jgi:ParB family transcriptional regulator, chromosome partitioning protein
MAKATGLGRGLGSLIPKKIPDSVISEKNKEFLVTDDKDKIHKLPVDSVEANPMQPRTVFDHEDLESLIESIKVHGIIQPIIVTKTSNGYQLIAGERRLRSAKIIGLETVPAVVREAGEQEKLELALIENVQRKNLNPIEKAVAYEKLMDEFSLSQEAVSDKLGVSRSAVANTVRFLDLPEKVQEALGSNQITEGHAKVIAGLDSEKKQLEFLNKILQYNFTVRDAEKESRKISGKKFVARVMKDPNLEEKEETLRAELNTKVNIKKQGDRGQVVIEFYSSEELDSIINKIVE